MMGSSVDLILLCLGFCLAGGGIAFLAIAIFAWAHTWVSSGPYRLKTKADIQRIRAQAGPQEDLLTRASRALAGVRQAWQDPRPPARPGAAPPRPSPGFATEQQYGIRRPHRFPEEEPPQVEEGMVPDFSIGPDPEESLPHADTRVR